MDEKRVRQILSSPSEIDVYYNGVSVWIEDLNPDGRTATVHLRGSHDEQSVVEIGELEERS